MQKNWDDYFDEEGILIHIPGPDPGDNTPTGGGDSINRIGHFWFCYLISMRLELYNSLRFFPKQKLTLSAAILKNWDSKEGCVCRHWKGYPSATDGQYGTSRDQFMPIAVAALLDQKVRGWVLLNYALKHFGFMPNLKPWRGDWNGDFLMPDHWSTLFRAAQLNKWYHSPIIWFGDLWRMGSVLLRLAILKRDNDNTGDSLNLIMELILGLVVRPNWMTKTAATWFREKSPISPQAQLDSYFAPKHAPPINELYAPVIAEILFWHYASQVSN